jgi:type IV pilus assembly protein PilW
MNNATANGQSGYTLVEILVVMLISFIILGGVYKVITTENIDLDREETILDMQLKARAALDIIADDVRKAGFLGCAGNLAADTTSNSGTADPMQTLTSSGIIGTDLPIIDALKADAGGVDYLGDPLAYVNDVPAGHVTYQQDTDVLSVRYLSGDEPLQTAMGASTTTPIDLDTNDFSRGDILYITDCEFYSLFQKTNCSATTDPAHATTDSCGYEGAPNPSNTTDDLGRAYGLNARVYQIIINTYFIQDDSFAISQNDTGTDIVDNIEDLQFQYKWDVNGNNDLSDDSWSDDPVATPGVTVSDIREIKIYVLARSDQVFTYTNTNFYDYPNSPYCSAAGVTLFTCRGTTPPNDNRYRYLASAVVTLRNSGL